MVVALAITTVLLATGVPSLLTWIQSAQIRTTAEAIENGLQLARAEALRRNALVHFQFTSTLDNHCALSTASGNWVVSRDVPTGACGNAASETVAPRIIQARPASEGGANAVVAAGQDTVSFNGLGVVKPTPAGSISINISNPRGGACASEGGPMRCLRVVVSPWGQVRLCDPALTESHDPQGCY
jgi:type IV fimbrial biogenesis protein FimT